MKHLHKFKKKFKRKSSLNKRLGYKIFFFSNKKKMFYCQNFLSNMEWLGLVFRFLIVIYSLELLSQMFVI